MSKWILLLTILASGARVKATDYDFYPTPSAKISPIVVFVHGGAWVSGSRAQYRDLAEALTVQGMNAVVVSYPLAPASKHPKQVEALEKILASLPKKTNANIDWTRLYLMGHSAGAHMIAMWNATYENPAVKGFIGLEGIYDLDNLLKVWPGYKDWFVAKEFGDDTSKYSGASPRQLKMRGKAPWLVVHSEKDELVDMAQSTDFVSSLEKQGVKAEMLKLKMGTHFGVLDAIKDSSSEIAMKIAAFVKIQIRSDHRHGG